MVQSPCAYGIKADNLVEKVFVSAPVNECSHYGKRLTHEGEIVGYKYVNFLYDIIGFKPIDLQLSS